MTANQLGADFLAGGGDPHQSPRETHTAGKALQVCEGLRCGSAAAGALFFEREGVVSLAAGPAAGWTAQLRTFS